MYGEILDEVVNYIQDGDGEDHVGRRCEFENGAVERCINYKIFSRFIMLYIR